MTQNNSILNSSYNSISYGTERTQQNSQIAIDPLISDLYEESTTSDITEIYSYAKARDIIFSEFEKSPFYEKYSTRTIKYTDDEGNETLVTELPKYESSQEYQKEIKKYKVSFKKIEKGDITNLYYHFRDILVDKNGFDEVAAFCAIAECFELNYSMLYNDIISIESKSKILNALKEGYGLRKEFGRVNKLY